MIQTESMPKQVNNTETVSSADSQTGAPEQNTIRVESVPKQADDSALGASLNESGLRIVGGIEDNNALPDSEQVC